MVRRAHVVDDIVVSISIVAELAEGEIDGASARVGDLYVDGVFTTPEPPPAPVPKSVTPRQFRLALESLGMLDDVEAGIAAADKATRITWEFAITIERDHPLLATMAVALGFAGADLDDIFRLAKTL